MFYMTLKYFFFVKIIFHSVFSGYHVWFSIFIFVFVVWLTDERRLALFPAVTLVSDPHHRESPTRCISCLNGVSMDMCQILCFIPNF